jgi:protein MpaA
VSCRAAWILLGIGTLLGIGCTAPMPLDGSAGATAQAPRRFGVSVEGRPLLLETRGRGPEAVLLLAAIHGNESAGTPLLQEFLDRVDAGLDAGWTARITAHVVLVANPDGFARNRRANANGVDLNRNFPSGNFQARSRHGREPLSEAESRALFDLLIELRPARVLSIHQPLACVDHDGPGAGLAGAMARAMGLPRRRLGSRPGSLGSFCGHTLGTPIVTLELPAGAEELPRDALWALYGPAVVGFVEGLEEEWETEAARCTGCDERAAAGRRG